MSSKWNPFNAVAPGGFMVGEVMKEKNKLEMPILSEDQKMVLQDKMLEAYNNQEYIRITYFKGGNMHNIEGIIEKIDVISKKIVINGDISIFFSQIVEIS